MRVLFYPIKAYSTKVAEQIETGGDVNSLHISESYDKIKLTLEVNEVKHCKFNIKIRKSAKYVRMPMLHVGNTAKKWLGKSISVLMKSAQLIRWKCWCNFTSAGVIP